MGPQESRISYISPSALSHEAVPRESTDTLVRDVRQHRDNIDSLLRELAACTHPKAMVKQAVTWFRSSENRQGVKDKAAEAGGTLKHKAVNVTESLKESGRQVGHKVSEKLTHLTEGAKTSSREVVQKGKVHTQEGFKHVRAGVAREMDHVKQRTAATAQDNPLFMALGCLGAGLVAGLVFPATRTEKRVGAEARDTVRRVVRDVSENKSTSINQAPFCDLSA